MKHRATFRSFSRRDFCAMAASLAAVSAHDAASQEAKRPQRIGWIASLAPDSPYTRKLLAAFWDGMRELGHVENRDAVIEFRSAEGRFDQFPRLIAELIGLKVDIIVAGSTAAARAAKNATSTIPIVCFNLSDPVGEKFAESLKRPGGNVTGMSILSTELVPKELSLLNETVPAAARIAGLWQPELLTEQASTNMLAEVASVSRTLGVTFKAFAARDRADLETTLADIATWKPDALLILPSPLSLLAARRVIDFTMTHHLPSMGWIREFAELGGLLSYGVNFSAQYRRGAIYIDKLMRGAKAADLPIEQPTALEFLVNTRTAAMLNLAIPNSVMALADEIVG